MSIKKSGTYLSANGETQVHYDVYLPEGNPRAILQISHGMTEHMGRYADFARFMSDNGVIVCGNDHLGHGATGEGEVRGYFAEAGGADLLVEDVDGLRALMRAKYRTLPYILLGHSMGSFIARLYMARYGERIDGAVISGTSGGGSAESAALFIAGLIKSFKGAKGYSKFLSNTVNNAKRGSFKSEGDYAWLTRDKEVQSAYAADPLCTFPFTVGGYHDLFSMLCEVNRPAWYESVPKDLPVLIISGECDPVGGYGAGVRRVYDCLCERELCSVSLKLYPNARHEVLQETDKETAYADVLDFTESVVQGVVALRTGGVI